MRTILINKICNEKPNSQALGAFNVAVSSAVSTSVTKSQVATINKMSESKLGKNIDIVRSQMQTVLNRHNPKTGIVGKDKEVYARLQAREKLYINARSKKTK
jgi:hypothetical protein